MTLPENTDTSQIAQWASRQLADYDARDPGTLFAERLVLDVGGGYRLQDAVARLRCRRGERVIGYKVGCTSPIIRAQLGIDHCVSGRLYDSERHPSGAVLSRSAFANLAIEGELAVELSLEPTESDLAESAAAGIKRATSLNLAVRAVIGRGTRLGYARSIREGVRRRPRLAGRRGAANRSTRRLPDPQ